MIMRISLLLTLLIGLAGTATADYVSGLDPHGDNFLALRSGPGTGYAVLHELGPNTELSVLETSGNWRRVVLNDGKTGWAFAKYIAAGVPPVDPNSEYPIITQIGRTGATLRQVTLRVDTASDSAALGRLRSGGGVIVLGQSGAWLRVLTEAGAVGFIPTGAVAIGVAPIGLQATNISGSGKKSNAAAPASEGWTRYVNPRFGTAINYPSGLFLADPPPANGDGRNFRSVDGRAEFLIYGQYNALDQSLSSLREDDRSSGRYDSVTYEKTGNDWYVLSGYMGDRVYYRRVQLTGGGDTVHVFEITYPPSDKPALDPITTQMSRSFATE